MGVTSLSSTESEMTSETANLANTKFHKSVDHAKSHMHCCIITFSSSLGHPHLVRKQCKIEDPGLHSTHLVTGHDIRIKTGHHCPGRLQSMWGAGKSFFNISYETKIDEVRKLEIVETLPGNASLRLRHDSRWWNLRFIHAACCLKSINLCAEP